MLNRAVTTGNDMIFGWTGIGSAWHNLRMGLFITILLMWVQGAPALAGVVTAVEVRDDRIVLTFDARVADASAFLLAGPDRIAVDVTGAQPGAGQALSGGPVAAVRQGNHGDGARIVFDLARPAIVTEGSFGRDGRTLTLMLKRVDPRGFAEASGAGRIDILPSFSMGKRPERPAATKVRVAVPAAKKGAALPRIHGIADDSRPLVVIDAGHGGHDPGAIAADGTREKDLTLATALAIRDALVKSGRVRVALTREDDRFLILQERYGIARRLGANLFISVHCDSAGNVQASGATAYTLSEVASDREAARLAARENKADVLAGVNLAEQTSDISSILIDLAQRETLNTSARFARLLGREAKDRIPTREHFHRMASLMVLRAPDMPSVLFETGYLSNEGDAEFLNSDRGRARIAETVRQSVEIHFATQLAAR